jgi:hypothetical protein
MLKLAGRGNVVNFSVSFAGQLAATEICGALALNGNESDDGSRRTARIVKARITFFLCKVREIKPAV